VFSSYLLADHRHKLFRIKLVLTSTFSPYESYNIFRPNIERPMRLEPMINKEVISEKDAILAKRKIKTMTITMSPSNTTGIVFLIFFHPSTMD
jgi:hypothetical protein